MWAKQYYEAKKKKKTNGWVNIPSNFSDNTLDVSDVAFIKIKI